MQKNIKGHTVIELTDTATGEVETFEHDNMVTGQVAEALGLAGLFPQQVQGTPGGSGGYSVAYSNYYSKQLPLYKTWLGGLALFDSALPESGAPVPSTGARLVGSAAYGVGYTGTQTEMGSYNASESEVTDNAVKHVFDFATNQGNGTIAALGLCHADAGLLGLFGLPSGRVDAVGGRSGSCFIEPSGGRAQCLFTNANARPSVGDPKDICEAGEFTVKYSNDTYGVGLETPSFALGIGNQGGGSYAVRPMGFDAETGKVAVLRFDPEQPSKAFVHFAPAGARLVPDPASGDTRLAADLGEPVKTLDLPASVLFLNNLPLIFSGVSDDSQAYYFAIAADTGMTLAAAGGTMRICEVRFDGFEASGVRLVVHNIVNNTGAELKPVPYNSGQARGCALTGAGFAVAGGRLVLTGFNAPEKSALEKRGYSVKMTDATDVREVALPAGVDSFGQPVAAIAGRVLTSNGVIVDTGTGATFATRAKYPSVLQGRRFYYAEAGYNNYLMASGAQGGINNSSIVPYAVRVNGTSGTYVLVFQPVADTHDNYGAASLFWGCVPCVAVDRLTTINNLGAPVTKTSDKTMKITYTLTW